MSKRYHLTLEIEAIKGVEEGDPAWLQSGEKVAQWLQVCLEAGGMQGRFWIQASESEDGQLASHDGHDALHEADHS